MPLNNFKPNLNNVFLSAIAATAFMQPAIALAANGPPIINPLGEGTTIETVITNVITWLLGIVAMLALLALIVGGIYIILGFANEDYVKEGKNIIKWAIIGLIIVGAAYAILKAAVAIVGL